MTRLLPLLFLFFLFTFSIAFADPSLYFVSPTPTNNTNNFTYGMVFNFTSNETMNSCYIEIDGENATGTLSGDSYSCSYSLTYAQHRFNNTYDIKGWENITGTWYTNTSDGYSIPYYGCGYVNDNATLLGDVEADADTTCFTINASNMFFKGDEYSITQASTSGCFHDQPVVFIISTSNSTFYNFSVTGGDNSACGTPNTAGTAISSSGTNNTFYNITAIGGVGLSGYRGDGIRLTGNNNSLTWLYASGGNGVIDGYGVYISANYSVVANITAHGGDNQNTWHQTGGTGVAITGSHNTVNNVTVYGGKREGLSGDNAGDGIRITGTNNSVTNSSISTALDGYQNKSNCIYVSGNDNIFYNNIFDATVSGYPANDTGVNNTWNITKTAATNLIGGTNIGGNYYSDYSRYDTDCDYIGDYPYYIAGSSASIDYLPITNNRATVFASPTPTNNTNNFTYGMVFNSTFCLAMDSCYMELDGANRTGVLAADNLSCSYTLAYAEHLFNNTYDIKNWANVTGTWYPTNETRVIPYYGCGYVNSNANLIGDVSISTDRCFFVNSSNIVFDGAGYTINGSLTIVSSAIVGIQNHSIFKNFKSNGFSRTFDTGSITGYNATVNNTFYNNTINYSRVTGIFMALANNFTIINNTIYNSVKGIYLNSPTFGNGNSTVIGNTLYNLLSEGINIAEYSHNITVKGNLIYNITSAAGIFAYGINNTYVNNTIRDVTGPGFYGIWITNANDSYIINNTIFNCEDDGIYTDNLVNVYIYNNNISNSSLYNAYDNDGSGYWNTTKILGTNIMGGSNIGGNYYSNYTGVDTDNDGIGDTSQFIAGSTSYDYLPLTNNFVPVITFVGPSPTDGVNNYTYGMIFNFSSSANMTDVSYIEVNGANHTCTMAADNRSCSYTLTYSEHWFNTTYTVLGYALIDGTVYPNTDAPYSFYYQGCGLVTHSGTLSSNVSINGDTCFTINGSSINLNGAGYTVTGDGTVGTYGVYVNGTDSSKVGNFTITNFFYGILINGTADMNNVTNNTIFGNVNYEVAVGNGTNNLISNNTITDTLLGYDNGTTTFWNSTTLGNFWSNYTYVDIDADGIGNIEQNVTPNGVDYLPATSVTGACNVAGDCGAGFTCSGNVCVNTGGGGGGGTEGDETVDLGLTEEDEEAREGEEEKEVPFPPPGTDPDTIAVPLPFLGGASSYLDLEYGTQLVAPIVEMTEGLLAPAMKWCPLDKSSTGAHVSSLIYCEEVAIYSLYLGKYLWLGWLLLLFFIIMIATIVYIKRKNLLDIGLLATAIPSLAFGLFIVLINSAMLTNTLRLIGVETYG